MSNGRAGTKWRFLIVEDNQDAVRALKEILATTIEAPDELEIETFSAFDQAKDRIRSERFDLLILDLKDDSDSLADADQNPAGLVIFDELKKARFVPVVFYTAHAYKVRDQETSFVRVVEKTEGVIKVKEEIQQVLATGLPALTRHLEELQRSYIWDFVGTHWKDFKTSESKTDIAYLMARRLAMSLQQGVKDLLQTLNQASAQQINIDNIHPMEMYVHPPVGTVRLAGDILTEKVDGKDVYWLLLTPSCDFAQCKAEHVVLAKCEALELQKEYIDWKQNQTKVKTQELESLIKDTRTGKREFKNEKGASETLKLQPERFKFLPGTFFMPDLVADFQQLRSVPFSALSNFNPLASLDSPFAEAVLARFARFFGRVGTPDIDVPTVVGRLNSI